eukprot:779075_1
MNDDWARLKAKFHHAIEGLKVLKDSGAWRRDLQTGWNRLQGTVTNTLYYETPSKAQIPCLTVGYLAGILAFRTGLAGACAMMKVMRISSATFPPIPTIGGVLAVGMSSVFASRLFIAVSEETSLELWPEARPPFLHPAFFTESSKTMRIGLGGFYDWVSDLVPSGMQWLSEWPSEWPDDVLEKASTSLQGYFSTQSVFFAVAGLVAFRVLGGRFRNVAPSDLWRAGAFARARGSLP